MKFNHPEYLPVLAAIFIVFAFYHWRLTSKFYAWVEMHWFYKKRFRQVIGNGLYLLGMAGLLISLMDLRGRESKIKGNIPEQKTIILIDSSSSMLAEDVRPNRFQKALLLARHFVKEAPGNQIAIMLFSDFQKSFVPFTNDVDLLDARISGLSNLNITKGGSNLSQALAEAVQYFNDSSLDQRKVAGNILVLSDAEETSDGFDLKIPEGISIGLVGVGTAKGGTIPMRDGRNVFYGNKTFAGKEVVTKLDEAFMRGLSSKIKNYKFWIASSFSLPTKEILDFFNKEHKKKFSQGDVSIKPVLMEWILIPSLLILVFGYLLKMQKAFIVAMLLFTLLPHHFISSSKAYAQTQDSNGEEETERPKLEKAELDLMDKMANGQATRPEKLKLADLFMRKKYYEQAHSLYDENLGELKKIEEVPLHINYGTVLIQLKELAAGVSRYHLVQEFLQTQGEENKLIWQETIRVNTLLAFKQQKEQGGKGNDKNQKDKSKSKDSSDNSENSNQNGQNQQKNDQSGQGNKDNNQPNKNPSKPQDDKNKGNKDKKEQEKKNQNNGEGEQEKKDQSDDQSDDGNEGQKPMEPQKKLKVKLPAQLKQLMNDDRSLQEKLLDTSTNEQFKGREKKDW